VWYISLIKNSKLPINTDKHGYCICTVKSEYGLRLAIFEGYPLTGHACITSANMSFEADVLSLHDDLERCKLCLFMCNAIQ